MQSKHLAVLAAAAAALAATPSGAQEVDRTGWPTSFTVGTASQGGPYFVYGSGWANLVAEELGLTGAGEVTGGPMQNMALVHTGDLVFGLTTLGPGAESLAGTNPIAPSLAMDNVCAIFPMYQTPFHLAALASSNIASIADIPAGARIGFAAGVPIPTVSQLGGQTTINIVGFTAESSRPLQPSSRSRATRSRRKPTRRSRPRSPRSRCGTSPSPTATCRNPSSTKRRGSRWGTMRGW